MSPNRNRLSRRTKLLTRKLFERTASYTELEELLNDLQAGRVLDETVAYELWKQLSDHPTLTPQVSSRIKEKMHRKLSKLDQAVVKKPRKSRRRTIIQWTAAAAVVIGCLIVGYGLLQDAEVVVATLDERRQVELPDGSKVTLNINSELSYAKKWNNTEDRRVHLSGEAFFDVQKDSKKFQVITKDITVEVLGTIFNVNTKPNQTTVYLQEGKIKLQSLFLPGGRADMNPGDVLVFSSNTKKVETFGQNVSTELHTSWKDGLLHFRDTPMAEVLQKIEDNYNVHTAVSNAALYKRKINTGIPVDDLQTAISILEKTMELDIELDGNVVIIKSEKKE